MQLHWKLHSNFFLRNFLITNSISLTVIGLFRLSISFWRFFLFLRHRSILSPWSNTCAQTCSHRPFTITLILAGSVMPPPFTSAACDLRLFSVSLATGFSIWSFRRMGLFLILIFFSHFSVLDFTDFWSSLYYSFCLLRCVHILDYLFCSSLSSSLR